MLSRSLPVWPSWWIAIFRRRRSRTGWGYRLGSSITSVSTDSGCPRPFSGVPLGCIGLPACIRQRAQAAGYADQAHLSRELRSLTGLTPRTAFS